MTVLRSKPSPAEMSSEAIELIAARFRVLGEASRLKLIHALIDSELSVNELTKAAGLTQANASRHLHTLTEAGILKRRKQGIQVLYSIADMNIFDLCGHVCGSLQERLQVHAKAFGS
jgi:ArsR family transcriptional regulator